MGNSLYKFTDNSASFRSFSADKISCLYLPLCNEILMSSITPLLKGDIKTDQHHFLLEPVWRANLYLSKASRNFWVYIDENKIWSAAGVSTNIISKDEFKLEAGQLWQLVTRRNNSIGLQSEILSFVPSSEDPLEIMQVTLTNITSKSLNFVPYAAIPLFCRGADNLRDHRQVTSLLNRVKLEKFGLKITPTLLFDESGHHPNHTVYFAAGCVDSRPAQYFYPVQESFYGESADPQAPHAVLENRLPIKEDIQGKETIAAMRFAKISLSPKEKISYTILLGIRNDDCSLSRLLKKFNSAKKINKSLEKTKAYWTEKANAINVSSPDRDFDNWLRWVNIQPVLRKIYGCSFLPDFDYGRGGRGWRDLWQDCLGLILNNPESVRQMLINNFCGVKIDGSNATIIGKDECQFIADRNNISRVWMDHGIWPLVTLNLYINETGDLDILFENAVYFRNHQINRSRDIDYNWSQSYGNRLKCSSGEIYKGTLLEHLILQNLVQFFNVGAHNYVRLEGADWNDGLDMAKEEGESVAFSSMYAENLSLLAELIEKSGRPYIELAEELKVLFSAFDYENTGKKLALLEKFFSKTSKSVTGKKARFSSRSLRASLKEKSDWMKQHIHRHEWLKEGFFNGYYDNRKNRVEGKKGKIMRMMLASQTFPIMSGTASPGQIDKIISSVYRYLFDKKAGGIRLNTNFKQEQHDLGRAFSFAYGNKENGAVFSHMDVMFAYALYKQGYAREGWKVLSSLYKMAINTQKSKIFPCLPEYFDLSGRGMYLYLTGSASWFMLTLLTQAFGVRGLGGDLLIEPKLAGEQFKADLSVSRSFAGRRLKIIYKNPRKLEFGRYRINKITVNSKTLSIQPASKAIIPRSDIQKLPRKGAVLIEVHLG